MGRRGRGSGRRREPGPPEAVPENARGPSLTDARLDLPQEVGRFAALRSIHPTLASLDLPLGRFFPLVGPSLASLDLPLRGGTVARSTSAAARLRCGRSITLAGFRV